ncbi:MAG: hypothetical protein HY791_35700 [Deltaproteobacteria bacterium]|nr:hypothetical protein [Deltaproteobacteria bacterium]
MRSLTLALLFAACTPEHVAFIELPQLGRETVVVGVGVECDSSLQFAIYARQEFEAGALRREACDATTVSVLEWEKSLHADGLDFGPVQHVSGSACGVRPLPLATRVHVASVQGETATSFAVWPTDAALPGALATFSYVGACACPPLEITRYVSVPGALRYAIEVGPDGRFLVFATGLSTRKLAIYATDLISVEHLETATVATGPVGSPGVHDVAPGPNGRFYLVGDFGEIYEYAFGGGVRKLTALPTGKEIARIAARTEGPELEILAVTREAELWMYEGGSGWTRLAYAPKIEETTQRANVTLAPDRRAIVVPENVSELLYVHGRDVSPETWVRVGSVQATASVPGMGIVGATRLNQVFRLDAARPAFVDEVLSPSGQAMDPTSGWFQQIRPVRGGFLATLDGPNSLLRFHESWGYCPLRLFDREDVRLERFAASDRSILLGGTARDPTQELISLPILDLRE